MTFVHTLIFENDVLDAEAGGVKGKDQGNSVLVASGERRSES